MMYQILLERAISMGCYVEVTAETEAAACERVAKALEADGTFRQKVDDAFGEARADANNGHFAFNDTEFNTIRVVGINQDHSSGLDLPAVLTPEDQTKSRPSELHRQPALTLE